MQSYEIALGYWSGASNSWDVSQQQEFFEREAQNLRNPAALAAEALRVERGTAETEWRIFQLGNVKEYADAYTLNENGPFQMTRTGEGPMAIITCSGGGLSRRLKESLARAFCRLMLANCHYAGIDININVV